MGVLVRRSPVHACVLGLWESGHTLGEKSSGIFLCGCVFLGVLLCIWRGSCVCLIPFIAQFKV